MPAEPDKDVIVACCELVGRTGARELQIGYLNEESEPEYAEQGPRWYAIARYRGDIITAEDHEGPAEATQALAIRLLTGSKCLGCGRLVALSSDGAFVFINGRLVNGESWTIEQAIDAGQCLWVREGQTWKKGCE